MFVSWAGVVGAAANLPFEFRAGDRVMLLGDTFLELEGSRGFIEHRITAAHPGLALTFRNLSWSADLPTGESRASFDWHRGDVHFRTNLLGQIQAVKPTVALIGYGMAASFGGPSGLAKFESDLDLLIEGIQAQSKPAGVRLVLLSPIRHEDLGAPLPPPGPHNQDLKAYAHAVGRVATKRGARFVDLFTATATGGLYTDNGIHPSAEGHRKLAEVIAGALGLDNTSAHLEVQAGFEGTMSPKGAQISTVKRSNGKLEFQARLERLPAPAAGDDPGGFVFLKTPGLTSGDFSVTMDGEVIFGGDQNLLQQGVMLGSGPLWHQSEQLLQVILKKNELFFHRWRPQNSTYLFLFRKHEQGRNAAEIPQFDPLIEEEEKRIAELRIPKEHTFGVSRSASPGDRPKPELRPGKTSKPRPQPAQPQAHPSFTVAEGLEVRLFAENPLLYKPIHMNFDEKGRLFVASSSVYPQIKPGQEAEDSIVMLEDTDGDGVADRASNFAEGLLTPTGVAAGNGGIYVGQSTELLHLKDTDGDGRADVRKTVLSGFGTEDTHHIIHTLHWGMDGLLYMNQSIYIHTHTETPNGVVRLNSGGILNLRPSTLEMGVYMKGLVNTWGHQFDLYGQSFATDGAGIEGINYIVPQAMYLTYAGARRILGSVSPGNYPKFCGFEILHSPLFPDDWQGSMITCDFRAHRIVRFSSQEQGSAYATQEMPEIVRTQSAEFRPIDVKMGPDGALYIADWSNPIIQHGEVDFRDPRRDKEHGRIWRVAPKSSPAMPKRDLSAASSEELLGLLLGASSFHREKARRVLVERGPSVLPAVGDWIRRQSDERALLEGLWLHQGLDHVDVGLLERLLEARDGRVRAGAVRVLSAWKHRIHPGLAAQGEERAFRFKPASTLSAAELSRPLELLARRIKDSHPRVRLETLRALAKLPSARSAELALSAMDMPLDKHLEYALWLTVNDLADPWLKALKSGEWKSEGREKQLEFGLNAIEPRAAGQVIAEILEKQPLARDGSGSLIEIVGQSGGRAELAKLFDQVIAGGFSDAALTRSLQALAQAARLRKALPNGDLARIETLLQHPSPSVAEAAIRLSGAWKRHSPRFAELAQKAAGGQLAATTEAALIEALREMGGKSGVETLLPLTATAVPAASRHAAIGALAAINLSAAIPPAIQSILSIQTEEEGHRLMRSLLSIQGGAGALTKALPKSGIPVPAAKGGLRAARESGRSEPDLVLALTRGADLSEGEASLSDAELKHLAVEAASKGDPARGEMIYRRSQLACVSCHAIGGAGGKVGPDMTSIGASAPMDYLIESLWFPNRKVKEGYHSLIIDTKDGQELSGILVSESPEQLVLRNTLGGEFAVAKNNIDRRATGGSLMPAGLIDGLSAQERLDLFRFLSELGRPGPYDASQGSVARAWKIRPGTHQDEQFGMEKVLSLPLNAEGWIPVFSLVDGRLPAQEMDPAKSVFKYLGLTSVYVATKVQTALAGPLRLTLEGVGDASIWINGKPAGGGREALLEVGAGVHTVLVRLDPKAFPQHLRVQATNGTFVNP